VTQFPQILTSKKGLNFTLNTTADKLKTQRISRLRRDIDRLNDMDDLKKDLDKRIKEAGKTRRSQSQLLISKRQETSLKKSEEIAKRLEVQRQLQESLVTKEI